MSYVFVMKICQDLDQLLNNPLNLIFWQPPIWLCLKITMQTLAHHIFHDQVHYFGSVNALIQLYYIRVINLREYLNLSECTLLPLDIHQLIPIIHLYGYFLTSGFVNPLFYYCICTRTYLFTKVIFKNVRATRSREFLEFASWLRSGC